MSQHDQQSNAEDSTRCAALTGSEVRRGWRFFHCGECEHRWKWPSRDALSPSGENCPRCDEWCHPFNHEIDASIPCDKSGNLTVPWNWQGNPPNDQAER